MSVPHITEETNEDSLESQVRLALVQGVGPRIQRLLLEHFETADAVLGASARELQQVAGVGSKLSGKIIAAETEIDVETELALCQEHGISVLTPTDEKYPRLLTEIPDPPAVLFAQGELLPQDAVSIAIVGTRHASQYGLQQAQRLAGSLSRVGLTIVSGLARGVDSAAHRAALDAGGRTLAVLGSGVLNIYPPENKALAEQVSQHGAMLSESPPRRGPMSGAFPQRNRIITGITLGVIVVEASARSGALISARHAMEQNREVFAVPGRVDSRTSHGCHQLIRDGAKLVESVDDVLEELGPLFESVCGTSGQEVRHIGELQLNVQERQVLESISTEPTSIDRVVVTSLLPVHRVLSTISVLEMRRLVKRVSGNLVARM